jgi:hypothetical protein
MRTCSWLAQLWHTRATAETKVQDALVVMLA